MRAVFIYFRNRESFPQKRFLPVCQELVESGNHEREIREVHAISGYWLKQAQALVIESSIAPPSPSKANSNGHGNFLPTHERLNTAIGGLTSKQKLAMTA